MQGSPRRILAYLAPYRRRAAGVCACIVLGATLNLAPAYFVKRIVDVAIPAHDVRLLWVYCLAMIAGPLLAGFVQMAQKYGAEAIAQHVMLDLRVALYRHFHGMPFANFLKQKPGEPVSHVLTDVQGVGGVVSGTFVDIVQNSVVLVSTVAFVLALDWRLAVMAIAFLPLFIVPARRVGRVRKALKRSVQERLAELTGIVSETLSVSGALLIKTSAGPDAEVRRFASKAEEIKRLALRQTLVGRWFRLLLGLFETIGPAVMFAVGGWLVIQGQIPLGTLVAFVSVMKRLYSPASDLASVHVDLIASCAYFDRVFAVLDRTERLQQPTGPVAPRHVAGAIEFRHVSFEYQDGTPALRDIDLAIEPGMKVGIVGPSGAGKSTLVSLLVRLYDAGAGSVSIDGVDVRCVDAASLRATVAIVTQETFLFHATVFENLRYGSALASREDVRRAARHAQIHDLIESLPEGYDTIVGERGYRFSAGECQRLSIARAILRDPRVLVLDEATSALDSLSERKVQRSLDSLLKGRTSLVVAHRLATVRDADLIVVMHQGRIAESGSHDVLLAGDGLYAWLWHAQSKRAAVVPVQAIEPSPGYRAAVVSPRLPR